MTSCALDHNRRYDFTITEHDLSTKIYDQAIFSYGLIATSYTMNKRWGARFSYNNWVWALKNGQIDDGLGPYDSWQINWIAHPYFGNLTYLYFRARGYDPLYASFSTFFQSLAFEFIYEASMGGPWGFNDIFWTPYLGVMIGAASEYGSYSLLNYGYRHNNYFAIVSGYAINPFALIWNNKNTNNPVKGYPFVSPIWDNKWGIDGFMLNFIIMEF